MIKLDIVTPSRKIVEGAEVESVRLPGAKGELEVLPGHTDLLTLLSTGPLSFSHGGQQRVYAISYGFAEVRGDKVLVLAETAEDAKDIDKARAATAEKRALEALTGVLTEGEFRKQQFKLQRAIVRQHVAT